MLCFNRLAFRVVNGHLNSLNEELQGKVKVHYRGVRLSSQT